MSPILPILCSLALLQPAPPGLTPVDPASADADALATSLRLVPVDLRTPSDFDRVYRLPVVTGPELFARIDRGLTAVFPRSHYLGSTSLIPAGTTWYIGPLPDSLLGRSVATGHSPLAAQRRETALAHLRRESRPTPDRSIPGLPDVRPTQSHPTMPWEGELHRRARVAELLQRAARAR